MDKAVIAVYKMVVGGKADKWFLVPNYADMVKVVRNCNRGYLTDIEAIKALVNLSDENQGKACFIVTKKQFDVYTDWRNVRL